MKTYHVQTGNLYERKSPAATNSSVIDVRPEMGCTSGTERTGGYPAMFFELAFLEYLRDRSAVSIDAKIRGKVQG